MSTLLTGGCERTASKMAGHNVNDKKNSKTTNQMFGSFTQNSMNDYCTLDW